MCNYMFKSFLAMILISTSAFCAAPPWAEKMLRQLDKHLTLDLRETKLVDAMDLVSNLTGLTIVVDTKVRQMDPTLTLKVERMDAATVIHWLTQLTETYADLKDQAIYITHQAPKEDEDEARIGLAVEAARRGVTLDLPPPGQPISEADAVKIALQLLEKEEIKIQDFPAPKADIGFEQFEGNNPFGAR
jgi:hypothetical protein